MPVAGVGGSLTMTIDSLSYPVAIDNNPKVTPGGRYINEKLETSEGPVFLADQVTGGGSDFTIHVFSGTGTAESFDDAAKRSITEVVPILIRNEAGQVSHDFSGGGVIILSDAADGYKGLRDGEVNFSIASRGGNVTTS